MIDVLVSAVTLMVVVVVTMWALWPRLRSVVEKPKHGVLRQIERHDVHHGKHDTH